MSRTQSTPQRFIPKTVTFEAIRVPDSTDYVTADLWWAAMTDVADWCAGKPTVSETEPNAILLAAGCAYEGDWILRRDYGRFVIVPDGQFSDLYAPAPAQV